MRPLLPLALLAALTACTPTQVLQVPTVNVQSVRLTSLRVPGGLFNASGPPTANLTLNLLVTNPNPIPLRMANIAGNLIIDGADVGTVNLPNVDLPASGSAQQAANVAIPVTLDTAANFLKVARGQLVTYRLDGSFTANFGLLGAQTFGPFTLSQGQWKQAAIIPF